MSLRIRVWAAVLLGVGSVCMSAQQRDPNEITLDVTVTDKEGHVVPGLQQQDFKLTDNKTQQQITSFQAVTDPGGMPNPPVEAVIVVDEVNTGFDWVSRERQELTRFLERDGGRLQLPTSLIFFSDKGSQVQPQPTRDGKALIDAVNAHATALRTINRAQGFYGAQDRFGLSVRTLNQIADYEAGRPGRKLVVWISPGWPLLSGPNVILTSKQQQGLLQSIVQTTSALERARITLYSVDPLGTADAGGFRTFYWEQFKKGVKRPNDVQIGNLGLQVFAVQSGGRALNSRNDASEEIVDCLRDASAYYVLSFQGRPADGPNDYHALNVTVDRPGVSARTRAGYYAIPADTRGTN